MNLLVGGGEFLRVGGFFGGKTAEFPAGGINLPDSDTFEVRWQKNTIGSFGIPRVLKYQSIWD